MDNPKRYDNDTIVAIATPPGRGGIGVIRLSGPKAFSIATQLAGKTPKVRAVSYAQFKNSSNEVVDTGLLIGFSGPHSFTGEDVVEVQGHGGPIIQDVLLKTLIHLGARQANAGEFSERAFLNNKIDLTQAEAIADLINSTTEQAALGAMRSLSGEFSKRVEELLQQLVFLRGYVEAAIDFPEEEIDFLSDSIVQTKLAELKEAVALSLKQTKQGAILTTGMKLVLAGKPNAGKSSLLNSLAGTDTAIVTPIAGTTRDIISQTIDLQGLPVHILDTAGLRDASDEVERIGVERAERAILEADHVLMLVDVTDESPPLPIRYPDKTTIVRTKVDLDQGHSQQGKLGKDAQTTEIAISVKTNEGIPQLTQHIQTLAGYKSDNESVFTARRRHIHCLEVAQQAIDRGSIQLNDFHAGELLADELLQAQTAINEITGEFTSDDLLGKIFSSFCIGK